MKTEVVPIGRLQIGDLLVNLGSLLEIEETENHFNLVIGRMEQRQVWQFLKNDNLLIEFPG